MAGGRPTKFNQTVKKQLKFLAEKGFIDDELAKAAGITQQTLNNWKKQHPKFFESLKSWKAVADLKVERSLYERACGYSHAEDKVFNNNGEAMVVPTIKHYPPDTTAAIFWLKNRQPKEWRDKIHKELTGKDDGPIETKSTVEAGPGVQGVLDALKGAASRRPDDCDAGGDQD